MELLKAIIWVVAVLVAICLVSNLAATPESQRSISACDAFVRDTSQLIGIAHQDQNPVFRLIHSTEALSLAKALTMLGRDESIERRYSINSHELLDRARAEQTEALQAIRAYAPGLVPADATSIAAGYVATN